MRSVKRVIFCWISWSSRKTSSSETFVPFKVAATASYSCAFSRASVILPTHLLRIPAIAIIRTPWPNGGMSNTYRSWPLVATRSAMASYVADSYMAGSADVESMYSSISGGISVRPYMDRIFCFTSSW